MSVNVGKIRRAIEGLPDDARVVLWQHFAAGSEGGAFIELVNVGPDAGTLIVHLAVTVAGEFDDDDDDDEEDD